MNGWDRDGLADPDRWWIRLLRWLGWLDTASDATSGADCAAATWRMNNKTEVCRKECAEACQTFEEYAEAAGNGEDCGISADEAAAAESKCRGYPGACIFTCQQTVIVEQMEACQSGGSL